MPRCWFPVGLLFAALLLLGPSPERPTSPSLKPIAPSAPGVVPFSRAFPATPTSRGTGVATRLARMPACECPLPPPPDTLRSATTTGTPLIRSLPAELNGAAVSRYVILDGPALSGVAGRSFTWIPKGTDPETVDVRLQARHPDAPADTLVLQIDVQP